MKYNFLVVSILYLFCACTTNISLDEIYEPKLVVQGQILENETAKIELSQTVSATDEDVFPVVKNAVIKLTSSEGESENLTENEDGIYVGNSMLGTTEKNYFLEINLSGMTYSAEVALPKFGIEEMELTLESLPKDTLDNCAQLLAIDFKKVNLDSVHLIFSVSLNGFPHQGMVFYENEQIVPQNLKVSLDTFNLLPSGNVVGVQVLQVEKWQYDYLIQAQNRGNQEIISGLLIGPPDNLKGNMEGGALGYFGAAAQRFLEITVP